MKYTVDIHAWVVNDKSCPSTPYAATGWGGEPNDVTGRSAVCTVSVQLPVSTKRCAIRRALQIVFGSGGAILDRSLSIF